MDNSIIDVKIKLIRPGVVPPEYATPGSAAMDLRAEIGEAVKILPGTAALIPTGIAIDTSGVNTGGVNIAAIICARSGLSHKHGVALSNGIGLIDSDYRGEIFVSLRNSGGAEFTVNPGDRIAQLMFVPVYTANLIICGELGETERGAGGFGSTGGAALLNREK